MTHITAKDVAIWMLSELEEQEYLFQEYLIWEIEEHYGDSFVYFNKNGNLAIGKEVLREFRKLTEGKVVWIRSQKAWRILDEDEPYEYRQAEY